MKVSELARKAGTTPSAVRFYESKGILPRAPRGGNSYREYSESDLGRLRLVVSLRGLGLNLEESGRLAALCAAGRCDTMSEDLVIRVAERRQEVARSRAELDHLDAELVRLEQTLRTPKRSIGLKERNPVMKELNVAVTAAPNSDSKDECDCECSLGSDCGVSCC